MRRAPSISGQFSLPDALTWETWTPTPPSSPIRIGDEGGVGVQVSHVKASGKENWPLIDGALRMLEDAKTRGVDVLGDVYPYNAGSTKLDNLMPTWAHDGGLGKLLERLGDRATRRKIAEECLVDGERWRTGGSG